MRKNRELRIVFLGIVVLFAVFLVIPALQLLLKSVWGANGLTVEFYASVFAQKGFGAALRNSFVVSAAAAAAAVMLAFVIAYAIHYTRLPRPCKRLLQAAATLPMFLPTITYGFAIIYSFGKQGLITQLLGFQMFNIYGFGGLMTGYVIYTVPVAFLLIHNTMGYIDKKTLTVSRVMGDGALSTFWIGVLRPLLGTLAGAFIQAFFLSFTDFGIPASVGGRYEVVATVLYNQMLGGIPDFNRGAVVAMIMLLPSVGSICLLQLLERFNIRYSRISDAGPAQEHGARRGLGAVGRHDRGGGAGGVRGDFCCAAGGGLAVPHGVLARACARGAVRQQPAPYLHAFHLDGAADRAVLGRCWLTAPR